MREREGDEGREKDREKRHTKKTGRNIETKTQTETCREGQTNREPEREKDREERDVKLRGKLCHNNFRQLMQSTKLPYVYTFSFVASSRSLPSSVRDIYFYFSSFYSLTP